MEQRARYWLIAEKDPGRIGGELHTEDFLCCTVPVGDERAMALEVFTSQEAAEAEQRGMDSLAPDAYLEAIDRYGEEFTSRMFENSESPEVVSLSRSDLVNMLDNSGLMYVLVDPLPGDQPQPERLPIRLAWEFAQELRDS